MDLRNKLLCRESDLLALSLELQALRPRARAVFSAQAYEEAGPARHQISVFAEQTPWRAETRAHALNMMAQSTYTEASQRQSLRRSERRNRDAIRVADTPRS